LRPAPYKQPAAARRKCHEPRMKVTAQQPVPTRRGIAQGSTWYIHQEIIGPDGPGTWRCRDFGRAQYHRTRQGCVCARLRGQAEARPGSEQVCGILTDSTGPQSTTGRHQEAVPPVPGQVRSGCGPGSMMRQWPPAGQSTRPGRSTDSGNRAGARARPGQAGKTGQAIVIQKRGGSGQGQER
jgi:hypothetical protein